MIKLFPRKSSEQALCDSTLFDNNTFYRAFAVDLHHARQSVYIESPFITEKRMKALLPIFIRLSRRGVSVIVNTRCPDEHQRQYAAQAAEAILAMQGLGIGVLYTVKHHRKLAIIDDDILWEGSLNILSQNDSCELMRRSVSQRLVRQMTNFIKSNREY